jgi:hypothetical protein
MMTVFKVGLLTILLACFSANAAEEWTPIGKTENGISWSSTVAEGQSDGSLRVFLRGEILKKRESSGFLSMFKKPESYIEKTPPLAILVHCKKKVVRAYVAGSFGKEFYVPWEPATPDSPGALALNAFCTK